uniref:Uncharacterized protein n=1 Tax=Timema shepardi TaxID=629360 RepID=A0A7R9B299_TIMSH|nr:unnamed protein product [Timema shepardi]
MNIIGERSGGGVKVGQGVEGGKETKHYYSPSPPGDTTIEHPGESDIPYTGCGMVIAYAEGMYLSWRTIAWLSLVYIAISLILVTAWIPESPLWLVARGRVDEADHSLKWFNGKNTQLHKEKLASMVKSQDMKALVSSGFSQRMKGFLKPTGYKPMLVLSGLFFFQQFSGIYSTLFYAVTFFECGTTVMLSHPAPSDLVLRAQRRGVELLRGSVGECVVLIFPLLTPIRCF